MVNNLSTEIIGNQQLRPLNNTYYGYLKGYPGYIINRLKNR